MGKKVSFSVNIVLIIIREELPDEISINTAEMTVIKKALREIHKREGTRWVIYTDSLCSMQIIEFNKKNHSILNQI